MRAASQADCSQGSRAHRKRDQDGRVCGTNMGAQAPPMTPGRGELQASLGHELLGQPLIRAHLIPHHWPHLVFRGHHHPQLCPALERLDLVNREISLERNLGSQDKCLSS